MEERNEDLQKQSTTEKTPYLELLKIYLNFKPVLFYANFYQSQLTKRLPSKIIGLIYFNQPIRR